MFETESAERGNELEVADVSSAADVQAWIAALRRLDRIVDDAGRITQLNAFERLKSAAAAAQVVVTADLVASQRAAPGGAGTGC